MILAAYFHMSPMFAFNTSIGLRGLDMDGFTFVLSVNLSGKTYSLNVLHVFIFSLVRTEHFVG